MPNIKFVSPGIFGDYRSYRYNPLDWVVVEDKRDSFIGQIEELLPFEYLRPLFYIVRDLDGNYSHREEGELHKASPLELLAACA